MADLKISELSALAGSNLVAADALAIVDDSASETKKITVSDLIANGVTVISDDTIPGAKILFGAGDIATAALADAAVTTAKVADDAITAAKLGNESTVDLVTTLPGAGAFTGQLAFDTDDNKLYVWDGSAWQSLKAAGSVNTVSGSTTGEINIVSSVSGDTVTLTATIDNTTSANQFLAGPTGAAGAVGYRVIDGSDLPVSTSSAKGGVIVNGEGLRMDANTIEVNNDVTASSTHHVVTYDAKGLITGGRVLAASDLPIATASAVGGVIASTGLTVDGSGNLTINNTVTADTYTKVTVAATGLVTAGSNLAASDLPNHSADLLTSGNIPLARIADNLITGAKLADYASAKIGETNPTADYIGQLFFNPLTRDLSLWDGNVFQPIGISAGEIVFAGTYNATTNLVSSVTADGTGAGFVVGQALPAASGTNKNFYAVVGVGGTGTSPAPAVSLAPPDFILSTGSEYRLIDVSETVTAQVASNVGFTPVGTIAANNVQTALAEVDTEKLAKSGGTMTGNLELNDANVVFEGSTENAFETTLTVVDPTADRTITLPNVTGAVVTTGDTGTVTSTMLTDGTIVNADINASAEIAVSKLANGTARQLLQTDSGGSGVEFTSNVDVPGTLDVTGAATLDSTLGVAGLISANGKVSFPLGSAAAPSLLPGSDTNTGIFSPGADALAITTGGTQRVTVDNSGNFGIGTTSPLAKLHIGAGTGGIRFGVSGATPKADIEYTNGGVEFLDIKVQGTTTGYGNIRFSTGPTPTERMRIDSSGKVGIGTTSPAEKLDVDGAIVSTNTNNTSANAGASRAIIDLTSNGARIGHFKGSTSAGNGSLGFWVDSSQMMRIDSSGRVGIGTTSPGSYSSAADDLVVYNSGSAGITIRSGSSNDGSIYFNDTDDGNQRGIIRYVHGDDALAFHTPAGESMRIDSSGNVGIGQTSVNSSRKVEITQPSSFTSALRVNSAASSGDPALIEFFVGSANYKIGGHHLTDAFKVMRNTSELVRIDSSGRLLVGATSPYAADVNFQITDNVNAKFLLNNPSYGTYSLAVTNDSVLALKDEANAAERMRIDSSGRVGIGNTVMSSFTANASDNLVVGSGSGGEGITIYSATNNQGSITFADGTSGNAAYRGAVEYSHTGDHLAFRTAGTGNRMIIDSSGRLFLGNTGMNAGLLCIGSGQGSNPPSGEHIKIGPSAKRIEFLDSASNAADTGSISLWNTVYNNRSADIELFHPAANTGGIKFSTHSGSALTERMRIDSSGRLLVGATAAVSGADANGKVQVSQDVGSNTCILVAENTASSGNLSCIRARLRNSAPNSIFSAFLQCDDSGAQRATIRSNGGLANYSANNANLSDRNAKKDISAAANTWDRVKEWEIVNYRYNDQPDDADLSLGVIAQQVNESCPEVVTVFQEAQEATETEPAQEERLGVKEQQMHWMAIKALQEAIAKIETLETKVAALEAG